jgi:hypothetical protein
MAIKKLIELCMFFFREYAVRNIYSDYCGREVKNSSLNDSLSIVKNVIIEEKNDLCDEYLIEIVDFFLRKYYHLEIKGSHYSIPQEDFFDITQEEYLNLRGFNVDSVYSKLTKCKRDTLDFMFHLSSKSGIYCTDAITLKHDSRMLSYTLNDISKAIRREFPILKNRNLDSSSYLSLSSGEFSVKYDNLFSEINVSDSHHDFFSDSHHAFFIDTTDSNLSISNAISAIGKDLTYYTIARKIRNNVDITEDDWLNYKKYNDVIANQKFDEKAYKRRIHALVMWDLCNVDGETIAKNTRDAFYLLDTNKEFCSIWSSTYTPPIDSWEQATIKEYCSQQENCYTQAAGWYNATEKSIISGKICPVKDKNRKNKPPKNQT